jgi:signal transduction histidine kinase
MKLSMADNAFRRLLGWSRTVRARSAVVSVAIVGAAFSLFGLGVTSVLRASLYQSAANTARAEAMAISSVISNQGLPVSGHSARRFLPISEGEMAAQVVGPGGKVLRSSRDVAGQPVMANFFPPPGGSHQAMGVVLRVRHPRHVDLNLDERFVVVAVGFAAGRERGAVLVAYSLGAADHAVHVLDLSLAVALPLLALLVGLVVWALTGWALRPVEAIRSEVAELSATDLRRRVPEPAASDEIGRLARTMNEMLARLEASSRRQRQLVADVSHELRNPLAALKAQLEVASEHPGGAGPSMLAGSVAEVDRMGLLVEDLLTLARFDEGMQRLRLSEVDLDELVLAEAGRLERDARIEISLRGVSAARVLGDEAKLARVVRNLSDNALRYARSRVSFSVSEEGGWCELGVADDGPGVPEADRQRIFERFVRLDTARPHEGAGAGLGLAIVREIVAAHGGEVWVDDARPGARFVVRLPLLSVPSGGLASLPADQGVEARSSGHIASALSQPGTR